MTYRPAEFRALQAMTRAVLEQPGAYVWTVQGLGMLRTKIDEAGLCRVNIWHSRFLIPNVSRMHTHPWNLTSWIVSGSICNARYQVDGTGNAYKYQKVQCGVGGGMNQEQLPETAYLRSDLEEILAAGDRYTMRSNEVHATRFIDGAVTLNYRDNHSEDHSALVFWPAANQWIDAAPRSAITDEIEFGTGFALANWDKS